MKIWENDNNKIYDNVHFSTESKGRILDELMKEIDKEFTDEGVKNTDNVDYTWESKRNEKMKKNNMERIFKTTVAAAFAVAASGAILYGVNRTVNNNRETGVAKQDTTIESMKETEQTTEYSTEQTTEQSVKGEDGYVKVEDVAGVEVRKIGEGFYHLRFDDETSIEVGDYTFGYNEKKGIIINGEDKDYDFNYKDEYYEKMTLSIITDGRSVCYSKGMSIYLLDLETNKTSEVCKVPFAENNNSEGQCVGITNFVGDKILIQACIGGWWPNECYVYNKNTNEVSKFSDGSITDVEGECILVDTDFSTDIALDEYDIYSINGNEVKKINTIPSCKFKEKVNDKYYFAEYDEETFGNYSLNRCNIDGSNYEKVVDFSKENRDMNESGFDIEKITDTYCICNGKKYSYDK